ncbi:hypothetical protein FRIGORI9N_70109 [Frigoribacterium sp. 9N]|nr:hypothetical protein FRIGORI9N_70109 [Frigoribacterium sp. 9N]
MSTPSRGVIASGTVVVGVVRALRGRLGIGSLIVLALLFIVLLVRLVVRTLLGSVQVVGAALRLH